MPYRCNTGVGRKSGKGAPTASSKLQLCRNYRAERIAGEECAMRLLREGVRLEVPGHLFIVYAPVLLLLLRDDNISRTNRSRSARHLFLSSLSIHLSQLFFPSLFHSSLFCTPLCRLSPSSSPLLVSSRGRVYPVPLFSRFFPCLVARSKAGGGGLSSPDALRNSIFDRVSRLLLFPPRFLFTSSISEILHGVCSFFFFFHQQVLFNTVRFDFSYNF